MCRFIGINAHGPTMLLKIMLLNKVDELLYDDKIIKKEGLSKLTLVELKNACAARGMTFFFPFVLLQSFEVISQLTLSRNEFFWYKSDIRKGS